MTKRDVDLRTLRRVVTLAKVLSYTRAAEQLGISQSVLTRAVQDVERQAKARLFDRDRAGVHLTTVGKSVVDRATAILRESDELSRMLDLASHGGHGDLSVGVAPVVGPVVIPAILEHRPMAASGPATYIAVRTAEALLPLLTEEKVEIVISPEGSFPRQAPIKGSMIGDYPWSLLVRAGHPILTGGGGPDNSRYPLISAADFGDVSRYPAYFRNYIHGAPRLVLEDYASLARVTAESDAIWIGSVLAAADDVKAGRLVELLPPEGQEPARMRLMLFSLDRRSLSPAAVGLKELLTARVQALGRQLATRSM